jgi:hypothetical protein
MNVNTLKLGAVMLSTSRKPRQQLAIKAYLLKYGCQPVDLSTTLLRHWHNRLNRELFQGKLSRVQLSFGYSGDAVDTPVDGYYFEHRIHIDTRANTRHHVLSTLVHEMVHQLQDEQGKPLTHGRLFKQYAKRFSKHGLLL